jgi:hypothetical protein
MEMKFFTLESANSMIPYLEETVLRLRELKNKILQKQIQIDTVLIVGGVTDPTQYAASGTSVQKDVEELNALVEEYKAVIQEVLDRGCQIKDPDTGLFDFYHILNDEIVNLCWKSGETEIKFYHSIDSGFASREPL